MQQKEEHKNYKQLAAERKKNQIDNTWKQVEDNPELQSIVKLRKKLAQSNKLRKETTQYIKDTKEDYEKLKDNIRMFLRKQNNTQTKSTIPGKSGS